MEFVVFTMSKTHSKAEEAEWRSGVPSLQQMLLRSVLQPRLGCIMGTGVSWQSSAEIIVQELHRTETEDDVRRNREFSALNPNPINKMSPARRLKGGSARGYSSNICDDSESAMKHGSGSKLSQETYKSDAVSDADSKRNDDKEKVLDDRKVLLAITVEIDDGCVEQIQLKEGDSAEAAAIKFCHEHALPEQFVAPLTEHIVNNIISISNEDSDIVFHSQEEGMSNDENSTLHIGAPYRPVVNDPVDSVTKSRVYGGRPVSAESNAMLARRESRKMDVPPKTLQASQKVNRPPVCCCSPSGSRPRKKTRRRKGGRKTFSDRLVGPTITSLAKCGALDYVKKPKARIRPLSEQAKAVCMRLYTEHIRHGHRCMDEVKRSNALYQENIVRRREGLSKIAKQYRNYGELLYAEGLRKRQNHIKAVRERAEQVESRELAEVTLMPKISKRSRNMRRNQDHVWSRLQSDGRPKQDQLQELRHEVWEAKLMECTFRPQINQKRRTDSQDQYGDYYSNRFEQLFLDAESRRRRRAECMQWHPEGVTFQPSINRDIPYGTSLMDDDCLQERSVFRRLVDNARKVMEKKQMHEQLSHRPFDPRTGRELFKPHIGRKPFNRNPVHLPIGEYLHRMNCAFNRKIKSLAARENKIKKEQARVRYVGPNSQRLLERLKDRGFKQVFDFLDTDKDGYVDLTTSNFDRLNLDVIDDLKRLMMMAGGKEKLDFERFADLMLKTETKHHLGQQVHLVLKHRRHNDGDNCTFQFRMDQLSRRLAKDRRKFSTHEQWWQIIIAEYLGSLQKIEKWRKQRLQQEMEECTFKPYVIRVLKNSRIGKGSRGQLVTCREDGVGQTISDIYEKVQQEVQGFYFQSERGGPELLGMPTPGSPESVRNGQGGKRIVIPGSDQISELDDLPKTKTGLFFGLMGA